MISPTAVRAGMHPLSWLEEHADQPLTACGTSIRTRRLDDAVEHIWRLRHRIGISRVSDITELDTVGVPVVSATRPNARKRQITVCQGKGTVHLEALASALFEAVERHAASEAHPTLSATPGELERSGRRFTGPGDLGLASLPAERMEWLAARDCRDGAEVWIPAAEALFPYEAPPGHVRPVRPSTTGLASGSTLAEAALHAIFEVVERDATSRFRRTGRGRLVPLGTIDDGLARNLLTRLGRAGLDTLVVDLTPTTVFPTFAVYLSDPHRWQPHLAVAGHGAHLDPSVALRRALAEAVQSRAAAIQGSREDLERNADVYRADPAAQRTVFLRRALHVRAQGVTSFSAMRAAGAASMREALEQTARLLERHGYGTVLLTDLTHPDIDVPVVHVSIPGLVDSFVDPQRKRDADE